MDGVGGRKEKVKKNASPKILFLLHVGTVCGYGTCCFGRTTSFVGLSLVRERSLTSPPS